MIDLPQTLKDAIEQPHGGRLIWLLELEVDPGTEALPPVIVRFADYHELIEWPLGAPTKQEWHPFTFEFSPVEQTQEGDLTEVDLTIDNTSRMLMRWLHAGNGLEGNQARLYLVSQAGLNLPFPMQESQGFELDIASAGANGEAITFRLALPNFFSIKSPTERYVPKRCRREFGSKKCGYVINQFAAFFRCPKTIEACAERGADLLARGLPVVLPGNYGGHPGISRRRR